MNKHIFLWVFLMATSVIAKPEDWSEFNSSLLIEVKRPNGVFTCTGVAVSKEMIITAGHCLDGKVESVRVFTQDRYDPKAPSIEVQDYKIHPNYDVKESRYYSDVAKIRLKQRLPDSINIHQIYTGTAPFGKFLRFGFGARNKRNIRTVITPKFKGINDNILELYDQFSYSGDSGGPIFLKDGTHTYIVAVHSTLSFGPQGNYSFNPLVGQYRDWIFAN